MYNCYKDLWLIKCQLKNLAYEGIESYNVTKLRVGAGDAITDANGGRDNAIVDAPMAIDVTFRSTLNF